MAFRFGDPGGRGYNTVGASQANLLAWWNGVAAGAAAFTITPGGGRSGGNSLRFNATAPFYVSKALDSQPTWGIAFAIKVSSASTGTSQLFSLFDGGTNQCDLRINSTNFLFVNRGATTLGTASSPLTANTWTHIEWLSTINSTTGTTQLRINGSPVLNLTAQNTRVSANNSANNIFLGCSAGGFNAIIWDMDDIIIYDQQLTDPQGNPDIHDFIGDCGLVWLLPTGAGTTTQFTPDSGVNYARVNEATPDGDTSYVEDATIGHIPYHIANLPGNIGSVKSMAVVSYTRKSDFSARGMKHELRTNSTNVVHTNEILLADSYNYYMSTWGQNPTGTPANWTVADINALEIGKQVSS